MNAFRTTAVQAAFSFLFGTMLLYSGLAQAAPATKEVEVVNDASNPVLVEDLDNPARQPFRAFASFSNQTGTPPFGVTVTTVPSDHRLVVEFLTVRCQSTAGVEPTVVQVFAGILHSFSIDNKPFGPGFSSTATHLTRMYGNPNSPVVASVFPTTNAATINCDIAITGHLVEL